MCNTSEKSKKSQKTNFYNRITLLLDNACGNFKQRKAMSNNGTPQMTHQAMLILWGQFALCLGPSERLTTSRLAGSRLSKSPIWKRTTFKLVNQRPIITDATWWEARTHPKKPLLGAYPARVCPGAWKYHMPCIFLSAGNGR